MRSPKTGEGMGHRLMNFSKPRLFLAEFRRHLFDKGFQCIRLKRKTKFFQPYWGESGPRSPVNYVINSYSLWEKGEGGGGEGFGERVSLSHFSPSPPPLPQPGTQAKLLCFIHLLLPSPLPHQGISVFFLDGKCPGERPRKLPNAPWWEGTK